MLGVGGIRYIEANMYNLGQYQVVERPWLMFNCVLQSGIYCDDDTATATSSFTMMARMVDEMVGETRMAAICRIRWMRHRRHRPRGCRCGYSITVQGAPGTFPNMHSKANTLPCHVCKVYSRNKQAFMSQVTKPMVGRSR
jgi:hypothetical protein